VGRLNDDRCFVTRLEYWGQVASIAQAIATTIALVLGAWWFREQREMYPHAQLEQTLQVVPVKPGLIAVEAHVQFDNKGMTRIDLTHANVKLQNVSEQPYQYSKLADLRGPPYWQATRPPQSSIAPQFSEGELRWPVWNQFDGPIDHLVEPGETDILVFTFVLPCRSLTTDKPSKPHFVRVSTDVLKPKDSGGKILAWKARSFADISNACRGKKDRK